MEWALGINLPVSITEEMREQDRFRPIQEAFPEAEWTETDDAQITLRGTVGGWSIRLSCVPPAACTWKIYQKVTLDDDGMTSLNCALSGLIDGWNQETVITAASQLRTAWLRLERAVSIIRNVPDVPER